MKKFFLLLIMVSLVLPFCASAQKRGKKKKDEKHIIFLGTREIDEDSLVFAITQDPLYITFEELYDQVGKSFSAYSFLREKSEIYLNDASVALARADSACSVYLARENPEEKELSTFLPCGDSSSESSRKFNDHMVVREAALILFRDTEKLVARRDEVDRLLKDRYGRLYVLVKLSDRNKYNQR